MNRVLTRRATQAHCALATMPVGAFVLSPSHTCGQDPTAMTTAPPTTTTTTTVPTTTTMPNPCAAGKPTASTYATEFHTLNPGWTTESVQTVENTNTRVVFEIVFAKSTIETYTIGGWTMSLDDTRTEVQRYHRTETHECNMSTATWNQTIKKTQDTKHWKADNTPNWTRSVVDMTMYNAQVRTTTTKADGEATDATGDPVEYNVSLVETYTNAGLGGTYPTKIQGHERFSTSFVEPVSMANPNNVQKRLQYLALYSDSIGPVHTIKYSHEIARAPGTNEKVSRVDEATNEYVNSSGAATEKTESAQTDTYQSYATPRPTVVSG